MKSIQSIRSQAMPIVQTLWRYRWLAVGTAWLVCTAGWIGTAFMPTKYESSARVYLNVDPLLTPLLRGLAADTDPSRHLDFMLRTLLSRPNLEQLIRLTDLDTAIRTPGEKEALFKRLATEIAVTPSTLNLLNLSYRDRDPQLAKNIVQSLLTIFAEKMAGSSRSEMDSAQRFLDGEIAAHRDQLRAAEKRRAELAEKFPDIFQSSGQGDDNGNRLEQARGAVARLKLDLADAVIKRDSLKKDLTSVPTKLTLDHSPIAGQLSPVEERLQELRRNLDGLLLKFTENHPDVKATRASIAQIQSEAGKSGGGTGSSAGSTGQIANGVYEQVKVRLVDAEAAVAAIQRRLTEAENDQAKVEKIAKAAPGILVQAQDLNRDYGIIKRNYEELVARRAATAIANSADTKTEKIQFRIVDLPQVPVVPAAPNRAFLVSVVLLLGIGAGLAVPVLVMQLDRSFATLSQLRNLGIPILGHVSLVSLDGARRQAAFQMAGVTASALVLVAVYGTLLVLSIGPRSLGIS